jgi:hypothetical protein
MRKHEIYSFASLDGINMVIHFERTSLYARQGALVFHEVENVPC